MINIDTRLLEKVDQNELWLLMHLAKRLNKDRTCWPSNRMLLRELGWSIDKLQKYKKALSDKGFLSVMGRKHPEGGQGSNKYLVKSEFIGVFINITDFGYLEQRDTEKTKGGTDTLFAGGSPPVKSNNEVLTNEVLTLSPTGDDSKNVVLADDNHPEVVTGITVPNTKAAAKKVELPEYKDFIRIWDEKYHHIGLKMPRDGAKIKALILETRRQLGLVNLEASPENTIEFWQIFINNLHKTWGHGKDLAVIESKYSSLIFEMEKGKQAKITPQNSASMAFGKYGGL